MFDNLTSCDKIVYSTLMCFHPIINMMVVAQSNELEF
jgi:hypothetical protein